MRKLVAAALVAGAMIMGGAGQAGGEPADRGNCISARDNGGDAGARISSAAGPGFGLGVASVIGGGAIGSLASGPSCRP